ncbi:biotin/lipoyl-containing protein [Mammaliicoccus fleurettii]|uniref:Acetyl-CoA carboxylase biotin carboxyl carrier protein subunit n=1 Tax=Mammaliicoccus fleurettii TaxID=150056 RepID=A0ABS5MKQ3_9STAP|nr:biotin/lipoyl-containing protein [Mammaliicoccus fleurettii]MBL0846273.1 acetyl-CoA carboxylase biotin carboxyl carrier protein subunit [Mammaliicoccus fleurettii]MBS3671126.1 acetyl-CoA carboxylase biotin carboxyl carrier protein subunit [Mammaliicoccus fleurettii]MBS3696500.1 acetyl-CoA carboxylase biotin carboxyl carrier protein subunit [Mammaliicoccus fleurettii]MBW0764178.1 acetyl-CoA carboxylase biotin carboxyl carrier protein subunit [Mammaliicoccus fleurettii]MEB6200408.1 acetyl-CoA
MNIKKIEEVIKLMKRNDVSYMNYKDKSIELELDLKNKISEGTSPETVVSEEDNNISENKQQHNHATIDAEILGTFYLQDEEQLSNPLVKVGDEVKKGQTIGYIESMKVLNEVICEYDGVVEDIHISHGDPVEYGQIIITLK